MTESRIRGLGRLGQSVWYDNIRRGELVSGEMQRLIDLGITGLTSNPTIFEKAIAQSADYDAALQELVAGGRAAPGEIFEELAVADIQAAADLLRPIYDATHGADGYASYEVPPTLAHDTAGTVAAARRLFARLARPNVMIKVPATPEGTDAVEQLIGDGVNVNVTLIFAIEAYHQVMEAYLRGLEARAGRGEPLDRVASVASFFISRIDTLVDKLLDARLQAATGDAERAALRAMQGRAAVASARLAYQASRAVFGSERFARLAALGARAQRPLWASTSTKNPAYPDTIYVDNLIAPGTVNTLPPATVAAFDDHGVVRVAIEDDLGEARTLFGRLAESGIDIAAVTRQLLAEGVAAFAKSYETLLQAIGDKRAALSAAERAQPPAAVVQPDEPSARAESEPVPARRSAPAAAKTAAKRAAGWRAPAKKASAKKAPARKSVKKPANKRPGTKAAKKVTTRKAAAKKPSARKPAKK